jgi:hypothetical protein
MKVWVDVYTTNEDLILREVYLQIDVPEYLEEDVRNCMKTKNYDSLPPEFVNMIHESVMDMGYDFIRIFSMHEIE